MNGARYTNVEFGNYFSDWDENYGSSGASSQCQTSRHHTTLPITVNMYDLASSVTDWKGKIGLLPVIDSTGISVSRSLLPNLSVDVGLIWDVTFHKQPRSIHKMICDSVSGINQCSVNTLADLSILSGHFKLQTTWPHEFLSETPHMFETGGIRWNSGVLTAKAKLEAIMDDNNNKVPGLVSISCTPYAPPSHSRWSGRYIWKITFLSHGGNIPALTFDNVNPLLEISDEDSGEADLYQGVQNSALFGAKDPCLAWDGNQIDGLFALSWSGNAYHDSVVTTNVFTVQTGGSSGDQYTALLAVSFKSLFENHVLSNSLNQANVVQPKQPTQWMSFSYKIIFCHKDLGGYIPSLTYMLGSLL